MLLNSKITLDAAERLADRVAQDSTDTRLQCMAVYRRVLSRTPSEQEQREGIEFLRQQTELVARDGSPDPARGR